MVIIGLGTFSPASRIRVPRPPQNSTTFIVPSSCGHWRGSPSQRPIETAAAHVLLDFPQPKILRESLPRQPVLDESRREFLDPATDRPPRAVAGNCLRQLVAIDPIASGIGSTAVAISDGAARDEVANRFGDIADL